MPKHTTAVGALERLCQGGIAQVQARPRRVWGAVVALVAVVLMMAVPGGALAGPPSNFVSAPFTGAAVVKNGSFRNLYLWSDPARQTWNAHLVGIRGHDPKVTTTTLNAITRALTASSYFDELSQYGINVPRIAGTDRTIARCVRPALRNASLSANHGVIQFLALVRFVKCETALRGDRSAQVNVFISPDLHVSGIGISGGAPDLCSPSAGETADAYHAFFPKTPNFTVIDLNTACSPDIASVTDAISHEMTETLSDPAGFGFIHETVPGRFLGGNFSQEYNQGELGDICSSVGAHPFGSPQGTTPWNAPVRNAKALQVAPYWSNADDACEPQYMMTQTPVRDIGSSNLPDGSIGLIRMTGSVHTLRFALHPARGTAGEVLKALELQIITGGDDLRGGSQADVTLHFSSGAPTLTLHDVNEDERWGNDSINAVLLAFPPGIAIGQISSMTISTHFAGGLFGDNWDIAGVVVKAAVAHQAGCTASSATLVNDIGTSHLPDNSIGLIRMTGSVHSFFSPVAANPADAHRLVNDLQLIVGTGGDDLRGGNSPNDNANAIITLRSGQQVTYTDINNGSNWGNNTTSPAITLPNGAMPPNTTLGDITGLTITTSFGGGLSGDNWDIASVALQAGLGCVFTAPPPAFTTDQLVNDIGTSKLPDNSIGLIRMTGQVHTFSTSAAVQNPADANLPVSGLSITVTTGGDDLRGGGSPGDNASVTVTSTTGSVTFPNINNSQDWINNSVETVNLLALASLRPGTTLGDITGLTITTGFGGGLGGDNWDIADVQLTGTGLR